MPFTPFHIGPALILGLVLPLELPVLLISSVILDIEPFYSMFISPLGYLHGFFHSYLGASIVGVALAGLAMRIRRLSFERSLTASLTGVYSHVFLDSFLYSDIMPFYPFKVNPFFRAVNPTYVYLFCAFAFLPAIIIGTYKNRKALRFFWGIGK